MGYAAWIKLEHTTPTKHEVILIADRLGIDPDEAFGKVARVWIWADQNTTEGEVTKTSKAMIDRIVGKPGFAEAMMEAGWLTINDGVASFPNFSLHNSDSAKKRARNLRDKVAKRSCPQSVITLSSHEEDKSMTPSSSSSMSLSDSSSGKEEGVGEGKPLDDVFQDLPAVLAVEPLKAEWLLWERYLRQDHSRPMSPMMRGPAWHKLLERAPSGKEVEFAISTIKQAMASGWKHLYPQHEEKSNVGGNSRKRTRVTGGDAWGDAQTFDGSGVKDIDPRALLEAQRMDDAAKGG